LGSVRYNNASANLLIIGNMYSPWRLHYKGVDVLLSAFVRLKSKYAQSTLTIAGEFDQSLKDLIERTIPTEYKDSIHLPGKVSDIEKLFANAVAYVHPSRGDALPNSVTEAMYAGIPTIVSRWTGGKDIIEQIDKRFVCDIDSNSVTT